MNILILLAIVLCGYSCEKLVDHTYIIRVQNNSIDTVQIYASYSYPDTLLLDEKPILKMIYPNMESSLESKKDWKEKLPNDTISIFILSKDTVDMYSWDKIKNDYNILWRYDLSLEDLEHMNWTVTYP